MFDLADFYDAELSWLTPHLEAALQIGPRSRVLDLGCGAGQTALRAARLAHQGEVLGVDVSAGLLEAARRRTKSEGLTNVGYALADAQTFAFTAASFDICLSRFGVMFFNDPAAAFANVRRALKPGGKLVLMVWGARNRNPWALEIHAALAPLVSASPLSPAFSLSNQEETTRLLVEAGFEDVGWRRVRESVFYGGDVAGACEAVVGLQFPETPRPAEADLARLITVLQAHLTPEGVLFGSEAWIITARSSADGLQAAPVPTRSKG